MSDDQEPDDQLRYPTIPTRPDGLQIDEHQRLQRGVWFFQRASWLMMLVVVSLGLSGFAGNGGPMSDRKSVIEHGSVEGPWAFRRLSADRVTVTFANDEDFANHEDLELTLDSAFFKAFELENVTPPPAEARFSEDGQTLEFAAQGLGPHTVTLLVRPVEFGPVSFKFSLGGQSHDWDAFVFP